MHSIPTSRAIAATKCIGLKHKLPSQLQRKAAAIIAARQRLPASAPGSVVSQTQVDPDLLATVLRVHLETKLRKERIRCSNNSLHPTYTTPKACKLQHAVNSIDDPVVQESLSTQRAHYGFGHALAQLHHQSKN